MSNGSGVPVIGAALVAIAIAVGGYFIGDGFKEGRSNERYVTVKGLSERYVKADVATWTLRLSTASNDLNTAQSRIATDAATVQDFLSKRGLTAEEISLERLDVLDQLAQAYRSGEIIDNRYIISQSVRIRTEKVELVEKLTRETNELLKLGVIVSELMGPSYSYNGLNTVKPEMIAEATRNARASAEQFAQDSGSSVGEILRANQGIFSILPRDEILGADESMQLEKKVRAVVTIDYGLES